MKTVESVGFVYSFRITLLVQLCYIEIFWTSRVDTHYCWEKYKVGRVTESLMRYFNYSILIFQNSKISISETKNNGAYNIPPFIFSKISIWSSNLLIVEGDLPILIQYFNKKNHFLSNFLFDWIYLENSLNSVKNIAWRSWKSRFVARTWKFKLTYDQRSHVLCSKSESSPSKNSRTTSYFTRATLSLYTPAEFTTRLHDCVTCTCTQGVNARGCANPMVSSR